ncbi:MAG TPA: prepilin peptidase [Acidobacteriota bacterium]|nr:prepilin peptidase [Acidobacteriota bacterium]
MIVDIILVGIALCALVIGSYTDLQRREIPDWINYSLLSVALGLRLMESLVYGDWYILLFGVIGAAIGYAVACIFYYTGQWGGGDAKMLIALGAAFGSYQPILFNPNFMNQIAWLMPFSGLIVQYNLFFLPILIANIFVAGAIYGVCWSLWLGIRHRKAFVKQAKLLYHDSMQQKLRYALFLTAAIFIVIAISAKFEETFVRMLIAGAAIMLVGVYYLQLALKCIEKACMIQSMKVEDLTEGEWIAHDVMVKGKRICGPKDLGVSDEQIKKLKRLQVKAVIVKIGIPFLPAFLVGFIVTVIFGNLITF